MMCTGVLVPQGSCHRRVVPASSLLMANTDLLLVLRHVLIALRSKQESQGKEKPRQTKAYRSDTCSGTPLRTHIRTPFAGVSSLYSGLRAANIYANIQTPGLDTKLKRRSYVAQPGMFESTRPPAFLD